MAAIFVLENELLGTYYVSRMEVDYDHFQARTRRQLQKKLTRVYDHHPVVNYFDIDADIILRNLNRNSRPAEPFAYGVDRWVNEIVKRIMKNPKQNEELRRLLTASWGVYYETEDGAPQLLPDEVSVPSTLSVYHVFPNSQMTKDDVLEMTSHFKQKWGTNEQVPEKYKRLGVDAYSTTGATRCLNVRPSRERGAEVTTDPNILYDRGRRKAIADMKRKHKPPKQKTIDKYNFTEAEINKWVS